LLYEFARYPEIASRQRYAGAIRTDINNPMRSWRNFAPTGGAAIDTSLVLVDTARLNAETKDARDYVNKHVAHLGPDRKVGPVGSGDWFGDINRGIDVLAEMIEKYWMLFHPGEMLASVTPVTDLGWTRMFSTPWLSAAYVPVEPGPVQ
jgi:hypothetical protein